MRTFVLIACFLFSHPPATHPWSIVDACRWLFQDKQREKDLLSHHSVVPRDIQVSFLDALASLGSMLESQSLINVFEILSNLGHIFRVCSVFYGKHCQRHNRLKYRVVLLKKLLKVIPQALNQNLALTSFILKYLCRAERPFSFSNKFKWYGNIWTIFCCNHFLNL